MNLEVSNPFLGTIQDRDHTYRTSHHLMQHLHVQLDIYAFWHPQNDGFSFVIINVNIHGLVVVPFIETKA